MKKKLEQALDCVRDGHIHEAAAYKKRRLAPWLGAVAAVLAVCICAGVLWRPLAGTDPVATLSDPAINPMEGGGSISKGVHLKYAIASPVYPQLCGYPLDDNFDGHDAWWDDQKAMHDQPQGYADSLQAYFADSVGLLLGSGNGENAACSPVNIYMALAMLAEITGGESREQLLELLNAGTVEALRTQAGQVWKAHYNDDGLSKSILASSLWLQETYKCNEDTAKTLADSYYASVFRGDLGSSEMNEALRSWLSEQTGGLLDDFVGNVKMDPRTVLALATTVNYQVQWRDFRFSEETNTEGIFHGAAGDSTETFMHTTLTYGPYYWDDRFGAVSLPLEDGSCMWLFLPDEGVEPEQLMAGGDIFDFLAQDPAKYNGGYENLKRLIVNLSIPKFDIASETDLIGQLQTLGVTDIFQPGVADFSPIFPEEDGGCVDQVKHAARVAIDEEGVTAAAFTMIFRAGAGMPPEDEMDLVFDRPFAFVIESSDRLPLFAGIVNEP